MRRLLTLLAIIISVTAFAQPQADYYTSSTLDGKCGRDLELALKAIVYTHTKIKYDNLWTKYEITDVGPTDSIPATYTGGKTDLVYDMYAWLGQFPKFYSDNDHTQTGGFNREHCVPNSWWGGEDGNAIAYTDLHHLVPGDGAANNAKSNWPLGEYADGMTLAFPTSTKSATTTTTHSTDGNYVYKDNHTHTEGGKCYNNASHVWTVSNSSNYGGASEVFEPADEYKGDFARMYLYVVCAYEGELTWQTNFMFTSDSNKYTTILDWAKALLLKWHRQDPVSDKERDRNNAVYSIQNNRNPFIDYPELVEYIWGNKSTSTDFALASAVSAYSDEYKNAGNADTEKKESSIMIVVHGKVGQAFHGFKYSNENGLSATYSSSNTDVAEVNSETGEVTLKAAGTAVITYTTEETAEYYSTSASYGISVEE